MILFFFFFNDTATTEIYTLSLHDALPICAGRRADGADQSRARVGEIVRERGGEMRGGEVRGSGARGAAGGVAAGTERSAGAAGGGQRTDLQRLLGDRTSVRYRIRRGGKMFVLCER